MKKKILLTIGAVALAAVMVFNASIGVIGSNAKMSAITLVNIEALAKVECWEGYTGCSGSCYGSWCGFCDLGDGVAWYLYRCDG